MIPLAWSDGPDAKFVVNGVPLPRPLDYMTREAEDVLGGVLDVAGIEQAVLLDHSDGATIVAINAGSVSDMRVRGLVLIAPHGAGSDLS